MGRWLRIGIIGGFGPRASAHFYRLLVDICSQRYQAVQDSDYPYVILVSLASEAVSETGVVHEAVLVRDITRVLRVFDKLGINVVAIPCNAVYAYLDRFPKYTQIQLVNLPEEVAIAASKLQAKDIGVVCSWGLRSTRAYDPYFLAKGIEVHYPEISTQALIDRWILEVMGGCYSTQTTTGLLEVVDTLTRQHDAVVLACSEISVLVSSSLLPSNVIDSMYILAKATLELALRSSSVATPSPAAGPGPLSRATCTAASPAVPRPPAAGDDTPLA